MGANMKGIFEKKDRFGLRALKVSSFIGYPPMFHTHGELIYVIKGSIQTVVDGKEHTLSAGEISLLFPYLTHSYETNPNAEAIILLFDPSATVFNRILLTHKPLCHYTDGHALLPMLERAVVMAKRGRIKAAVSYLNVILGELFEVLILVENPEPSDNAVVRILEYCSEHFSENITVKQISEALYLSQSYISKIFSDKLKYSFREYINSLRIDKARALLEQTDKKIIDIMNDCGFSNQSSFNRVFRTICGLSPKEYRKGLLR